MNTEPKLTEAQKQVIKALRNGGEIRKMHYGIGTTKVRCGFVIRNGGGTKVTETTIKALHQKGLLQISCNHVFQTKYLLTKLGKKVKL